MSSALPISVVICAYTMNRWNDLCRAVQGVRSQSVAPCEIILVIDHNPALLERAGAEIPGVTLVSNSQARGLAGARNTGVAVARGDVIAFMDEDAVPTPNWLETLCSGFKDSAVLGVGGAVRPLWQAGCPAWFPEEFEWVVGCTFRGMPEERAPVRNLIGCNMSFRRSVFETVGGFRHDMGRIGALPIGCEETEFCIRVREHAPDKILLYEPRAVVWHQVPRARSTWNYFSARCYAEGLSKAHVAELAGARVALSTERRYTFRTLPAAMLRNLARGARRLDARALARAAVIPAGLGLTLAGYLRGKVLGRPHVTRQVGGELETSRANFGTP